MILGGGPARHPAPDQEGACAPRMGCSKHRCHRRAFRNAEDNRRINADGIHHRADIIGTLFESCHGGGAVGQPGAPLVEADQPEHGTQTLNEVRPEREFPVHIQVGHRARGEYQGVCAVAGHLVSDKNIAAFGVTGFRPHPLLRRKDAPDRCGALHTPRRPLIEKCAASRSEVQALRHFAPNDGEDRGAATGKAGGRGII